MSGAFISPGLAGDSRNNQRVNKYVIEPERNLASAFDTNAQHEAINTRKIKLGRKVYWIIFPGCLGNCVHGDETFRKIATVTLALRRYVSATR